jgi:hypothetical protein
MPWRECYKMDERLLGEQGLGGEVDLLQWTCSGG